MWGIQAPDPRQVSADEAIARNLFEQEIEGLRNGRLDARTPLMNSRGASNNYTGPARGGARELQTIRAAAAPNPNPEERAGGTPAEQNQRVRMNVLQNGMREVNNRRLVVFLTLVVNIPQLLAAVVILSMHWNDDTVCDVDHRNRWKWWAVISAIRIAIYTSLLVSLYFVLLRRPRESSEVIVLSNARNGVDALGLIWFVVGNMWLFGQAESCTGASSSPVYQLCVAMILITYLHICLPCIIAMLMIPILCFCLPCVIRILSHLHDPMRGKGANRATINKLLTVKYRPGMPEVPDEPTCPICLVDYEVGVELRCLPCKHSFHKRCVDEWLLLNASCPNCRTTILEEVVEETKAGEEIA